MAPNLTEEEIDDLVYFARVGEDGDVIETLTALSEREKASPAEILLAAKDEGKSTALHMAAGNGHLGKKPHILSLRMFIIGYEIVSVSVRRCDGEKRS
jgi:hypothetical protein